MRIRAFVAALVTVCAASVAQAGFFDLTFNDELADAWAGIQFGDDEEAGFLLGGRFLWSDEDDVDATLPAVMAGFSGRSARNEAITFQVGLLSYLGGEAANQDVEGVAVGGSGRWAPDAWKGGFVGGRLYWSPEVFAMGDTESIVEWAAQGGYNINPKIRGFLEYTKINVDLENGTDVEVKAGVAIGFGIEF